MDATLRALSRKRRRGQTMRRAIVIPIIAVFTIAVWSNAQQPPELPQKGSGPGKPMSPQEAQKLFKLDDGLRIELVACEPQIESPVAMAFDPDGRLWVVEMRDYPNGPGKGEKPMGRIRILEDKDGDGFFETSTIWADNLLFANGLLLWKDGAIVTMAPQIAHLRDTKGAGKADKSESLYMGFAAQNPQLRVSHPILGLDGWIYCANGLRGGKVQYAGDRDKPPPVVDLSGMDFRFDPISTEYEAITGPGQFGNTFDAWGNRFICDNRHHLRHVVMENRYIKRNPYLAAPALVEDISVLEDGPLNSGGKVYPISKNWTTSSLHEGRFTAACGVFIYHGQLLDTSRKRERRDDAGKPVANASGSFYNGAAFTCEPTGNLVHMEILTPKGATFSAKPHKQGVEFLATTDDWCRPVFMTHGPEGALYVVDMYRAVIEHPDFMPPELKNRPDLWAGKDKGRIWRIVPKNHVTKTPRPGLSKASIAELVKTLEHEEPWQRTTAQRLLLEKNDKAMIEPLLKFFVNTKSPHAKILAAYLLDRHYKSLPIELMFKDAHPRVREHAIRIVEARLGGKEAPFWSAHIADLIEKGDPHIRFQAALSLGESKVMPNGHFGPFSMAILAAAEQEGTDRWTRMAALSAPPDICLEMLGEILVERRLKIKGETLTLARELTAIFAARKDLKEGGKLIDTIVSKVGAKDVDPVVKWALLAGLADGLERRGATLVSVFAEIPVEKKDAYRDSINDAFTAAAKDGRNGAKNLSDRLTSLRILTHAPWSTAKEALIPLVEKEPNTELRIAALRALATQQDDEVPTLLMKLWSGAGPSVRREILEAMLRQPGRVNVLLDEIESKRMKASELDPLRTRQLTNHKDAGIRARAKKLLADNLPADRQKILKEYQAALTLKADAKNGREVFKKNCAVCHRVAGVGVDVGPDIADTRTKTTAALLFDIIVPNAAIDANYVNYVVATKDGRILTGLLTAESASSITLVRAENQTDVVLRKDIDEIASTGISLMPDGLESKISVQEMADLLGFLKNWRYLDGTVPIGK
jgi:putative membrane-bound dehydrogenase-like protein